MFALPPTFAQGVLMVSFLLITDVSTLLVVLLRIAQVTVFNAILDTI
jgi:hypothetical protein